MRLRVVNEAANAELVGNFVQAAELGDDLADSLVLTESVGAQFVVTVFAHLTQLGLGVARFGGWRQ